MRKLNGRKLSYFPLFLAAILIFSPVWASQDYDFYKKHGHHKRSWNDAVKKGFEAYDAGDCTATLKYLKNAIAQQCQDALVYFKVAVCTEQTGSPYSAMQYYQLSQEKLQELPEIHRYQKDIFENYGRALFKAKRHKEALPYLNRAAAVGTPSFGLYYMVGYLHAQKKDWNATLDYFRKALTQDTSGVSPKLLSRVYLEVGRTHYQKKEYKIAINLFDNAVRLDPENKEAIQLRNRTKTLLQQASMVEIIQSLTDKTFGKEEKPPQGTVPPAASKLPPLEGSTPKKSVESPTTPTSPETTTPTQLAPLPPPPP